MPRSRDPQEARLDPVGAVLSIIGIVALVYGLIEAPERRAGRAPPTLVAFGIAAVVLTVFAFWELHTDEPMLDMRFFRNPAFSTGTAGMILVFLALYGVMFLVTQYFQLVLGYSPLSAAARLLPMALIADRRVAHHAADHRPLRRPSHRGGGHAQPRPPACCCSAAARHRHAVLVHHPVLPAVRRRAWRWRCRR